MTEIKLRVAESYVSKFSKTQTLQLPKDLAGYQLEAIGIIKAAKVCDINTAAAAAVEMDMTQPSQLLSLLSHARSG